MTHRDVRDCLEAVITARGYTVQFDMPEEGFTLFFGDKPVDQNCAADELVNHLAGLLEIVTTSPFTFEGSPAEVAAQLLNAADPAASTQMEWEQNLAALTEVLTAP